ncbi:hypothetical protein P7K49_011091 [Saguinus oedipus]|uniref:Uncharacterized protein n=1 Tax=Saguinus oedipus TaxID=9490 RepID=A0ABQ9VQF5_SAGOE|nr:hypothetical protein P7K49_011091 [Saguinus oedipus]
MEPAIACNQLVVRAGPQGGVLTGHWPLSSCFLSSTDNIHGNLGLTPAPADLMVASPGRASEHESQCGQTRGPLGIHMTFRFSRHYLVNGQLYYGLPLNLMKNIFMIWKEASGSQGGN